MALELVPPSVDYSASFVSALHENEPPNAETLGGLRPAEIERNFPFFVAHLLSRDRERNLHRIPGRTFWAVSGGEYIGRISVRSELTEGLWQKGGHIGYEVRPSARGQGHATEMLRQGLLRAYGMGLNRVLLTCNESNEASRRVIEKCDGFAISSSGPWKDVGRQLRFWISTVPSLQAKAQELGALVESLRSSETVASLARDPYWPKWDSPWWHMVLLLELGLAHRIPHEALEALALATERHYLHFFPFREEELPPGKSVHLHVLCHCALGTLLRLFAACEIDLTERSPWILDWLERYQLPDGGFNCDEEAYLRPRPVSSILSTTALLEGLLECERLGATLSGRVANRAADYLLEHRVFISKRTGLPADKEWTLPLFPRFYRFDVLRGLAAVVDWCDSRTDWTAWAELEEAVTVSSQMVHCDELRSPFDMTTLLPPEPGKGEWGRGPATRFPLLQTFSEVPWARPHLRCQWNRVMWCLERGSRSHEAEPTALALYE